MGTGRIPDWGFGGERLCVGLTVLLSMGTHKTEVHSVVRRRWLHSRMAVLLACLACQVGGPWHSDKAEGAARTRFVLVITVLCSCLDCS